MTAITRGMVLAAGMGTRMRPLTDSRPKPLVEVCGKPLVDHVLDRMADAGVLTAVVNVHHHADMLEAHLKGRTGPDIVVSDEREHLLDSGGGIRKALPALGSEPFFVMNADTIWIEGMRPNLPALAQAFDPERMDVLLLLAPTAASMGYDGRGDFLMDEAGRLSRRPERDVSPFVYAGAGVLHPRLFDKAPEGAFSLNRLFDKAAGEKRLFGLRLEGLWMHVGTPQAIAEAETCYVQSAA